MILQRRQVIGGLLLARFGLAQSSAKRVILLLGPPASGKSTQAEILKTALTLPAVSMAEILKKEGRGKGGLNKNLRAQIASGELVSDEMANALIQKRITQKDCERGFILDGYPFTAKQAEYFEALLTELGLPRPKVIHLSITDLAAFQRTQTRGRADDSPANAERRIVEYRREAELMLSRYPDAVNVDATKSTSEVAANIRKALGF